MANNSVRYPPELRERAVRMVLEATREGVYSSEVGGYLRGGADAGSYSGNGPQVGSESPGSRFGTIR